MLELLLLLSLIILAVVIVKTGLHKMILGALDDHAAKVRAELDEAKRLREEAQHLLAEHQRQLETGEGRAKAIVEQAHVESARMLQRHGEELKASLKRREEQAMARIAREEAQALQEVRVQTASLAIQTTRRLLAERITGPQSRAMLDGAIEEVSQKLA